MDVQSIMNYVLQKLTELLRWFDNCWGDMLSWFDNFWEDMRPEESNYTTGSKLVQSFSLLCWFSSFLFAAVDVVVDVLAVELFTAIDVVVDVFTVELFPAVDVLAVEGDQAD
ncbi:unnamed protein product [Ilex paraguariensis]|uniref:Uncharacterized protein n=1 Tax=Ilex paraguariensis TaxID=185542 RepID=A0ABC8RCP2_9AQUA